MAIATPTNQKLYAARWRKLFATCLAERSQISEFEQLAKLATHEFPVSSRCLVEVLLDLRTASSIPWDPLIPEYLDSLYRQRTVRLQDVLSGLLHSSIVSKRRKSGSHTERGGTEPTTKKRRTERACDTLMSDFRIVQNGMISVTSGYPPLTREEAVATFKVIIRWIYAMLAWNADSHSPQDENQPAWLMSSPDAMSLFEAFGILIAGLLTASTAIDAISSPKAEDLRASLGKALRSYMPLCEKFSLPLRMRLEALQKQFGLFDQHEKELQENVMGGMHFSALDFETSIIDDPVVNSRAGLYVYLNAMLAGRPLIDDGLLSAYLRNRYGGNLMTIVDELITAAFDILANGKWRKEHQQNMFLLQTFLINKVPSFLQQMASSVQPIPMELAISRALARIDPNTFPSFSQMFSMQGSSALSDVRQEFLFSCALHRLIPEASIERLLGENPMQSLPSGGQMSRNDVSSQIIQHTDRLEQLLNKMESMDGNASIIAVALTDALKHFCEKNDATSLKRICVAVAKRPQVLDVIMLFNQPTDFLGPLNSLLCSWEWRGSGGRKQEYEAFGSIFLFILAFYYRFELTPADLNTTDETFIMKLLGDGQTAHHLDDLTKEQNEHVGSWIEAFFVSEGITDGSIKTDPREFYMLVPTLVSQCLYACECQRLAFDTLKGGLEYFLEPCLIASLVVVLNWLSNHVWGQRESTETSLRILEALVKPESLKTEAQDMHHTVLYLTSRTLENALKDVWICQPDKAELIKPSGEVLKKYHSFQRTPAVRQSTLEGWLSTSTPTGGGIVASIRSVFSSLAWWSSRPGFIQTPFAYTHCQIIAGIRTVGAVRVLLGIIDELRLQAETGSLDIALDVAASLVCAPLAESFARDQATLKHQQAINEEKPSEEVIPRNPASTFMSLRDALNLEHDSLTKETISKDEFRAQLIMRLFRRVSTLTAPPQPISHDVEVANLDMTNMMTDMGMDNQQGSGDPGVPSLLEPVPGGGETMSGAPSDNRGLTSTFDEMMSDMNMNVGNSSFMDLDLDGLF